MKMKKSLSALACGLAAATVAQAQTQNPIPANEVFLAGSTAFRAQVYQGLTDLGLTPNSGDANFNNTFTFSGTVTPTAGMAAALTAAGYSLPAGFNGQPATVYCAFDGSAQGIGELQSQAAVNKFENVGNISSTFAHSVDLAFSDVQQASTAYGTPSLSEFNSPDAAGVNPGDGIAVQPFVWACNAALLADLNAESVKPAINRQIIENLLTSGYLDLQLFTGNSADKSTKVYLTGRDNTSGTRISAQQEVSWAETTPIRQFVVSPITGASFDYTVDPATISAGSGNTEWYGNSGSVGFPSSSSSTLSTGGYSSGGKVCDALAYPGMPPAVGYISFNDAKNLPYATALSTAAAPTTSPWAVTPVDGGILDYEACDPVSSQPTDSGQTASPILYNIPAVIYGLYPYWAVEHLYESNAQHGSGDWVDADAGPGLPYAMWYEIQQQGTLHGGTKEPQTAVLLSDMHVYRTSDAGTMTPQ